MILALCLILAAAVAPSRERLVAVLPVESGTLDAGAASALESEVRAAVVEVLGNGGVVFAPGPAGLPRGSRAAPGGAGRGLFPRPRPGAARRARGRGPARPRGPPVWGG